MKRLAPTILGLLLALIPQISYEAETACSVNGYSVIYINGILTDEERAKGDTKLLYREFQKEFPEFLTVDDVKLGYNASHLGGIGDIVKSIAQKMWELEGKTKEDFDLLEIVRRVQPQVHTQKILIVGHSQGTFYANALYEYLMRRGVSAESVAVLNLAAPVSYTAGHGAHLTSTNDELVRQVRALAQKTEHPQPLPANLDIPKNPLEQGTFAGHSLADVYLAKRSIDIVASMYKTLASLKSDPTRDRTQPCIPEPDMKITHYVKGASFALLDTVGNALRAPLKEVAQPIRSLASAISGFNSVTYEREAPRVVTPTILPVQVTEAGNDEAAFLGEIAAVDESADTREAEVPAPSTAVPSERYEQTVLEPVMLPPISSGHVLGVSTEVSPVPAPPAPPPTSSGLFAITGIPQSGGVPFSGSGGGGGAAPAPVPEPEPEPEPTLTLTIDTPTEALVATTTLTVTGTVDLESEVMITVGSIMATTTANGAWSFSVVLEEGMNELTVYATSTEGLLASAARTVTADVTAPAAPTLSIVECASSLSPDFCLRAGGNITLSIEESLDDALYWEVAVADTLSTSTERTHALTLSDDDTYTISVTAFDEAGNASAAATTSMVVYAHPLIINEVAWAGTTASRDDTWVELLNVSPYTLTLDDVVLTALSGAFAYELSGTLVPFEVTSLDDSYLIESRSSATTMAHNQIELTLVLADEGDQLTLTHGDVLLDETPAIETCGGWCAGALKDTIRYSEILGTQKGARSMERIAGTEHLGALSASWQTNDTYIYTRSAPKDASGEYILGTPKKENLNALPLSGWYCGAAPFEAGASYVPESDVCVFLSAFMHMNVNRYGALFHGIVGSSTEITRHSLGKNIFASQGGNDISSPVVGDPYFAVVYELRSGPSLDDVTGFTNYFTGVSSTPPHGNYRVFEWLYGE